MQQVLFEKKENVIIVHQGKSTYEIRRHIDKSINLDTWRVYSGKVNGVALWEVTDIEGPIKRCGDEDFISGFHGDERYTDILIYLDDQSIDEDADVPLTEGNKVSIYVSSEVYFCNNTKEVAFKRYKELKFSEQKLIISNKWLYIGQQTFDVECFTGYGLYSVYKDILLGYSTNCHEEIIHDRGTKKSPDIVAVSFYGEGFKVTVRTLSPRGEHYVGYVNDFAYEKRPRFKAYLLGIDRGTKKYLLEQGNELNTAYEIEVVLD